jgi:protein-tyrosine phosphatase
MTIVFVCTGNTCRSPLAVAAWRAFAPPELAHVEVLSAGLAAQEGRGVARHSQTVARGWGVDLSSHRARQLEDDLVARADLICAMTGEGAFAVRSYFAAPCVRVLGEFRCQCEEDKRLSALMGEDGTLGRDIIDPYGGSLETYEACGAEIRRAVCGLVNAVRNGEFAHP